MSTDWNRRGAILTGIAATAAAANLAAPASAKARNRPAAAPKGSAGKASSGPIRLGVLQDVPGAGGMTDPFGQSVQLVVDAANKAGGAHGRPIELVYRAAAKGDAGSHDNVATTAAAWDRLVNEDQVVGIIGPSTTPAAIGLAKKIEAARIPEIHWAGTPLAWGDWYFQYQAGYFPDEGPLLAYLIARKGHARVACLRSEGAYGEAYLGPFVKAARESGVDVVAEIAVPLGTTDVRKYVADARAAGADALVAMGLFGLGVPLSLAIHEQGWDVARYGNLGFSMAASGGETARKALQGWIATDMYDPHNHTLQVMSERYKARYGALAFPLLPAFGSDMATLMVEGLRRAPEPTRTGLRAGLEQVRDLPAAGAGAGTRMGFGPHDRLALKGPRVFLLSEVTAEAVRPYPA